MDTLQKAIKELKKVKKEKQLGVFNYLDTEFTLKFIAQQALDIDANGNSYGTKTQKIAYHSAINQFGEPLVNAAIELYNS
ncbi:MAG: hypothetical protein IPJ81_06575 [Chitinophagaceae bacterium]|nr:hypothetical protein [Chitinophagaceae bacterium]